MIAVRVKSRDTAFDLGFEEYLFSLDTGDDFFVLWTDDPAVVVGRFQNVFRETDVPLALRRGVGVFRRITGGGAVWHGAGNLNYTFISDRTADGADGGRFTRPVADALRRLGVPAETDGSDVTVRGVKVSGSARASSAKRTIHHGTLLFDADLSALSSFTSSVGDGAFLKGGVPSRRTEAANIAPLLTAPVTFDEFASFIGESVAGTGAYLTEDDFDLAAALANREKYLSPGWTYGENPRFEFSGVLAAEEGTARISYRSRRGVVDSIESDGDLPIPTDALAGLKLSPGEIARTLAGAGVARRLAERVEGFLLTGK